MERTSFLDTEKFKEVNEIYADALEVYMKELREEPRSLRKFLGASDERSDFFLRWYWSLCIGIFLSMCVANLVMPYKFTFDLSKVPKFFFTEIARVSYTKGVHKTFLNAVQDIIKKFRIQEATGLNLSDAVVLLQDLIDLQAVNLIERKKFLRAKKKALFLPHCSRKYMDNRCKAFFDASIPSYTCSHCSKDCLVNVADHIAKKKGYDVYVLPGASCIPKILKTNEYEGVVGVACGEEIRLSGEALSGRDIAGQAIPLIKNGCANTAFSMETLVKVL